MLQLFAYIFVFWGLRFQKRNAWGFRGKKKKTKEEQVYVFVRRLSSFFTPSIRVKIGDRFVTGTKG